MIRCHTIRTASMRSSLKDCLPIERQPHSALLTVRSYTTAKYIEELSHEREQKVELETAYKRVWEYNHRLVSELDSSEIENKTLKVKLQEAEKRHSELLSKVKDIIGKMEDVDDQHRSPHFRSDMNIYDIKSYLRRLSEELRQSMDLSKV